MRAGELFFSILIVLGNSQRSLRTVKKIEKANIKKY